VRGNVKCLKTSQTILRFGHERRQKQSLNFRFIPPHMRMPMPQKSIAKWAVLGVKKPKLKRNQMQKKGKKKLSPKQKKLAAVAPPRNKITRADIITLRKKSGKRK